MMSSLKYWHLQHRFPLNPKHNQFKYSNEYHMPPLTTKPSMNQLVSSHITGLSLIWILSLPFGSYRLILVLDTMNFKFKSFPPQSPLPHHCKDQGNWTRRVRAECGATTEGICNACSIYQQWQMVNGTGNGIGIGPAFKEYQQTYLSVTLNKKNPEGRLEKPH